MPDDQDRTVEGPPAVEWTTAPPGQVGISHTGAISQSGGVQNVFINSHALVPAPAPAPAEDPRQKFLSDFLRQALSQGETTFRLSVIFMSAGAIVLLCGGVLALMRHGASAGTAAALMTSLGGVLIGTCGGAFAVHANRSRKHLTAQAERVSEELRADLTREQVLALIDRIDDPVARDRLRSFSAMQSLGLAPTPDEVTNRVFPSAGSTAPEIEPTPPAS